MEKNDKVRFPSARKFLQDFFWEQGGNHGSVPVHPLVFPI